MVFSIVLDTGKQKGVSYFSWPGRPVNRYFWHTEFGTCLAGEEQAAVGDLRRCIREDFPEEAVPKLRPEAGGGVIWAMGRKAKASKLRRPFCALGRSSEFVPRVMEAMDWF